MDNPLRTVVVVGAGVAGLAICEGLRAEGYEGRLLMIGEEPHRPYDRPKLSKEVLQHDLGEVELRLISDQAFDDLGVDLLTGVAARAFDPGGRRIELADGRTLVGDRVILACGAAARRPPFAVPEDGRVSTLRSLDDALRLRAALSQQLPLVIVGTGFIGTEVAASARILGCEVTLVDALPLPLSPIVGERIAKRMMEIHRDAGVQFETGCFVNGIAQGSSHLLVELSNGRLLEAGHVLVAVGAEPRTNWLDGSSLALDSGVVVDRYMRTSVPEVLACGDVAAVRRRAGDGVTRCEHFFAAGDQARIAARTAVHGQVDPVPKTDPYFWSDIYDHRLQLAGHPELADRCGVVQDGEGGIVVEFRRGLDLVGVLALDSGRAFRRLRRGLVDVEEDNG